MKALALPALVIVAAACWTACASPATTSERRGGGATAAGGVPRAPDGRPDLSGVWQGGNGRRGTWEEANSGLGVGGTGADPSAPANPASQQVIRDPAPYTPAAARRVLESYNLRGIDDPVGLCLPAGVPRSALVGLFPLQIVQTPTQIVILYEYMSAYRVIPLDVPHPDDLVPAYMGDSVGRWEGDTLVVDVVGFNDRTWLTGTGTWHSEALHVTERYTRVDQDQINYDVTMEDPNVLTRPWTIHTTLMRRDGTRLREYVCAENNTTPERYEKLLASGARFRR
jgi:hypothetical protein